MKKHLRILMVSLATCLATVNTSAQGWPENYKGVMLQGFYWDSYSASSWTNLQSQAQELSQYFNLVWLPQSGNCGGQSMGYDDYYWFPGSNHYTSSFGTEAQLRSLITTFKNNGIGTIADVVINHRRNVSSWFDFPSETYNGVTYQMVSTDICKDDDGGATLTQANKQNPVVSLSANKDTGEGWDGMRDLDHNSTNVQTSVKAYLKMLLNDLGYTGFRYDMVKGYAGSFTGIYNEDANPTYSVGEYWDGNVNTVKNWLNATKRNEKIMSAAFDFPFRYTVRDAINGSNWTKLSSVSLVSDASYRRYAVTFVENHDTEYRSSTAQQDPIRKDTLAANAFLLAMPGTPCIFFKHWLDCKQDIKAMIDVRKAAGIHNMSTTMPMASNQKYYAVLADQKLLAVVGTDAATYIPTNQNYIKVLEGYHYAYYLNKNMETAWADKASGTYNNEVEVMLTAVSANSGAQLVYTTNGSNPTASSTKVASGTKIKLTSNTTLKVGLLIGSTVSGIVTRTYDVAAAQDITVYVNAEDAGWATTYINIHSWGDGRTGTTWPGDRVLTSTTIDGKKWFYKEYTITPTSPSVNIVFSTVNGSPQSVDVNGVNKTSFFEVTSEKEGAKYKVNDVTSTHTGIDVITTSPTEKDNRWYTLSGQIVSGKLPKGIYIHNGKKIVVK